MSQERYVTGLVIKQQLLGEADIILTFFSEESGKLRLVLKSAKRMTSRLQGGVQPFLKTKLGLVGRSNLQTVISAEPIIQFRELISNESKMHAVLSVQEFLNRALPDAEANLALFKLTENYYSYLDQLPEITDPKQLITSLVTFYSQALTTVGFEPELISKTNQDLPEKVFFSIIEGGFSIVRRSSTDIEVNQASYRRYKQLFTQPFSDLEQTPQSDIFILKLVIEFVGYQFDRKQRAIQYFL